MPPVGFTDFTDPLVVYVWTYVYSTRTGEVLTAAIGSIRPATSDLSLPLRLAKWFAVLPVLCCPVQL